MPVIQLTYPPHLNRPAPEHFEVSLLRKTMPLYSSQSRLIGALSFALALYGASPASAIAQTVTQLAAQSPEASAATPHSKVEATEALLALPDAPVAISSSSVRPALSSAAYAFDAPPSSQVAVASHTDKYILPGQSAPSITAGDKFVMGIKDAISPLSIFGWLASAGYSQLVDSAPNYGTDRGAFGQRLGASAIRAASEGILGDSIMSPLFHEDPRYYQLGRSHNFFRRLTYSATRAIITRTDSGRSTPNFGQISGNLEGAILANAYYPSQNRTVKDTAQTFAGSVGGSALGFVVSEFLSDTLEFVHLKDSK